MTYDGLPGPGARLGSYVVEHCLGRGGMAAVLAARHVALGKRVAIKMLLPHCAVRPDIARRFVREGEAVARLFHPHVVDVADVGTDERGAPYLVMEYLEGEDLGAFLQAQGRLSIEQTADLLVPVVSAIAAAHDAGIVHRDLKPQNLFLARERDSVVPKVLDFGISKLMHEESVQLTGSGAILGTPYYLSPEQAQGMPIDERTDQFSLGVILYECATGRRPFEGETPFVVITGIVKLQPPLLGKLLPVVDPRFEALVQRALHKDPSKRFANMRALGHELALCSTFRTRLTFGQEFGLAPATISVPPLRPARGKLGKVALMTAGAGALLGTIGFVLLRDATPSPAAPTTSPALPRIEPASVVLPEATAEPERTDVRTSYEVSLQVDPPGAQLSLDGALVGRGRVTIRLPVDGVEHVLEASLPGFQAQRTHFRDLAPDSSAWTLERLPSAPPKRAPGRPVAALPPVDSAATRAPATAEPSPARAPGASTDLPAASEPPAGANVDVPPRYGANHALIVR